MRILFPDQLLMYNMIRVKGGAVSQGECRSSTAKLSWLDACEDWQVVRWSGSQTPLQSVSTLSGFTIYACIVTKLAGTY